MQIRGSTFPTDKSTCSGSFALLRPKSKCYSEIQTLCKENVLRLVSRIISGMVNPYSAEFLKIY